MKYLGAENDIDLPAKTGVLLVNLGTPKRPVCPGLRAYLAEFLTDPRVIELPTFFRQLLVRGIIINVRSHKSAAAYREVWTDEGSPLLINTNRLCERLRSSLAREDVVVDFAMRYGDPSVADVLQRFHKAGVRELIAIPMYPQYSGSTTGSVMDAIGKAFGKHRWVPSLDFISDYYREPEYIKALANSVRASWDANGRGQKLLMSFHGVPKAYIKKGDPYQRQCEVTAQMLAQELGLTEDQWMLVYQSRLGAQEWLKPYCDKTLAALPQQGIKSIDMMCPGFSADCLETLEEINQENREIFEEAGGEGYNYIHCLNDNEDHVNMLLSMLNRRSSFNS